ncbi:MAG: hypothetical protein WBI82_12670, partial [Sphaerochaeta sp.]
GWGSEVFAYSITHFFVSSCFYNHCKERKGGRLTQSKGPHRSLEEYFLIYLWDSEESEEAEIGKSGQIHH